MIKNRYNEISFISKYEKDEYDFPHNADKLAKVLLP